MHTKLYFYFATKSSPTPFLLKNTAVKTAIDVQYPHHHVHYCTLTTILDQGHNVVQDGGPFAGGPKSQGDNIQKKSNHGVHDMNSVNATNLYELQLRKALAISSVEVTGMSDLIQKKTNEGFKIYSMEGNGDCCFELMCRWKRILSAMRQTAQTDFDGPVNSSTIQDMRCEIADFEERAAASLPILKIFISLSLKDWYNNPVGNGGQNARIKHAVEKSGVPLDDWVSSQEAILIHSNAIRHGLGEVFGEMPELESFALFYDCNLHIYMPGGNVEVLPQSV